VDLGDQLQQVVSTLVSRASELDDAIEFPILKIWVDADACPVAAKEILFRAVERTGVQLNMRDFMGTMRSSGVEMRGGPSAYGQRDKQEFANNLDRFLTR